jgi:peptidoglycan/LPS O-acetylase OafA/YrhL
MNAAIAQHRDDFSGRSYAARLGAFALVALLTLGAVVGIFAVYSGNFSDLDWQILLTIGGVALFTLTALEGAYVMQRRDDPLAAVGGLAMTVSAVTLALTLYVIWGPFDLDQDSQTMWQATLMGIAWSISLGHVSLMLGRQRESDGVAVKGLIATAAGFAIGVAAMLTLALIDIEDGPSELFWQTLSAMAIVVGVASLLTPVVRRLQEGE